MSGPTIGYIRHDASRPTQEKVHMVGSAGGVDARNPFSLQTQAHTTAEPFQHGHQRGSHSCAIVGTEAVARSAENMSA